MQQIQGTIGEYEMNVAKVFTSGRSQAVRIPKEYRFDVDEVFINKIGDTVMLTPVKALADMFEEGARSLTDDFLEDGVPASSDVKRMDL